MVTQTATPIKAGGLRLAAITARYRRQEEARASALYLLQAQLAEKIGVEIEADEVEWDTNRLSPQPYITIDGVVFSAETIQGAADPYAQLYAQVTCPGCGRGPRGRTAIASLADLGDLLNQWKCPACGDGGGR